MSLMKNNHFLRTEIVIRPAIKSDLICINDIYNYYVENSTCTYQTSRESMHDRYAWFNDHNEFYPLIVAEKNNVILGWASLSKFKTREAYKPTVENSIYIRNDYLNQGLGTLLLEEIIEMAKNLGYHSIIAGISAEQDASIKLHEKFGFERVAYLKEVGFKFNKWLDDAYYQLLL